jgi:hypothetical protein
MAELKTAAVSVDRNLFTAKCRQISELIGVLIVGASAISCGVAMFGDGPVASIGAVWAANLLMLAAIYAGLWSRGQNWGHLGLHLGPLTWKPICSAVLKSLPVFAVAIIAFAAGAVLMANLVGMPEPADMSKYDYLHGNLGRTLLALVSVYFVSSFAEEVIYRGFLITRIRELFEYRRLGTVCAVVLSALIFGLVHSDWGLAGMVQASCMGIALGASYLIVQRNLWVTILAHVYMDTILILQMYFSAGA